MTAISATSATSNAVTDYNTTQTEQTSSIQSTENISHGSTQDGTNASSENPDFATVLNNVLDDQQAQLATETSAHECIAPVATSAMPDMGMIPGLTMPGMNMGIGNQMMEQSLLNAVSNTGSSNDQTAQAMLMMLMVMMQSGGMGGMGGGGMGGDTSMMQMMISAILPMLQNSQQNLNNPQMNAPFNNPMNDPFGAVTNSVGGMSTSSVAGFGSPILPLNVSQAATPVITSNLFDRHPARYRAVINQFQVETAERYRPGRDGNTFCNIFVLDVVRAMGAHIPHLGAINMCNWLGTTGRQYGWREVDAATAQAHANMGRPAVTSAGSIGHVQMVVPSSTPFNPQRGVSIAQAGRINTNYAPISTIYGENVLQTRIRYFIHD